MVLPCPLPPSLIPNNDSWTHYHDKRCTLLQHSATSWSAGSRSPSQVSFADDQERKRALEEEERAAKELADPVIKPLPFESVDPDQQIADLLVNDIEYSVADKIASLDVEEKKIHLDLSRAESELSGGPLAAGPRAAGGGGEEEVDDLAHTTEKIIATLQDSIRALAEGTSLVEDPAQRGALLRKQEQLRRQCADLEKLRSGGEDREKPMMLQVGISYMFVMWPGRGDCR